MWEKRATKNLRAIDYPNQRKVLDYLNKKVAPNPRSFGRELVANYSGLWRYRVGDFRIVCRIEDDRLRVLVVRVAHRKEVYERFGNFEE